MANSHDRPAGDDDQFSRRNALRVMGGVGLGLGVAGMSGGAMAAAAAPSTAAATTPATPSCVLAPEIGDGPYYLDLEMLRRDITEDRAGVSLDLKFIVVNAVTCAPIRNAAVDIWMCDAAGVYSGYAAPDPNAPPPPPNSGFPHQEPVNDETFLRGVQLTDAHGAARLLGIYPGWYQGRAVHIHVKVHIDGRVVGSTYQGGHVSYTGQVFFPEAMNVEIEQLEPYKSNPVTRVVNGQDAVYNRFDGASTEITLRRREHSSVRHGLSGVVTVGVDPDAVPPAT